MAERIINVLKPVEIYARYLYLYDQVDYLPSLRLDATFLEDGIDY